MYVFVMYLQGSVYLERNSTLFIVSNWATFFKVVFVCCGCSNVVSVDFAASAVDLRRVHVIASCKYIYISIHMRTYIFIYIEGKKYREELLFYIKIGSCVPQCCHGQCWFLESPSSPLFLPMFSPP